MYDDFCLVWVLLIGALFKYVYFNKWVVFEKENLK